MPTQSANRLSDKVLVRDQARVLRKDLTDAEKKLWAKLIRRQLDGLKFRRQHPIGPYIADFACPERGLVVELDGGQHAARIASDRERTRFIQKASFKVLRFWNEEVLIELDSVLERITCFLNDPHPDPLPTGQGIK
jgi:very-short-patch-repair endonuclease